MHRRVMQWLRRRVVRYVKHSHELQEMLSGKCRVKDIDAKDIDACVDRIIDFATCLACELAVPVRSHRYEAQLRTQWHVRDAVRSYLGLPRRHAQAALRALPLRCHEVSDEDSPCSFAHATLHECLVAKAAADAIISGGQQRRCCKFFLPTRLDYNERVLRAAALYRAAPCVERFTTAVLRDSDPAKVKYWNSFHRAARDRVYFFFFVTMLIGSCLAALCAIYAYHGNYVGCASAATFVTAIAFEIMLFKVDSTEACVGRAALWVSRGALAIINVARPWNRCTWCPEWMNGYESVDTNTCASVAAWCFIIAYISQTIALASPNGGWYLMAGLLGNSTVRWPDDVRRKICVAAVAIVAPCYIVAPLLAPRLWRDRQWPWMDWAIVVIYVIFAAFHAIAALGMWRLSLPPTPPK